MEEFKYHPSEVFQKKLSSLIAKLPLETAHKLLDEFARRRSSRRLGFSNIRARVGPPHLHDLMNNSPQAAYGSICGEGSGGVSGSFTRLAFRGFGVKGMAGYQRLT
ncbi:hypothetical protein V8C37DRAFT_402816 [Trichoderma ceciliae]